LKSNILKEARALFLCKCNQCFDKADKEYNGTVYGYYPFPAICGFLIDNTGSLLLTTQKLQKLLEIYTFFVAIRKCKKVLRYLKN